MINNNQLHEFKHSLRNQQTLSGKQMNGGSSGGGGGVRMSLKDRVLNKRDFSSN